MTLGQRVAVMRDGRIVQVDVPQRLYQAPRDLFVAAFIGSPSMNLVEATVNGDEIAFGQFRVPLGSGRRPPRGIDRVVLGVRPEAFDDAAFAKPHLPRIDVTVAASESICPTERFRRIERGATFARCWNAHRFRPACVGRHLRYLAILPKRKRLFSRESRR